jgi:predicted site-specific integrase-resolvase
VDVSLATVRNWAEAGFIRWVAGEGKRLIGSILDVIGEIGAKLNFNRGRSANSLSAATS